jgi:hypothetical protein
MKKYKSYLKFSMPVLLLLIGIRTDAQYSFSPSTKLIINQSYNNLSYDSIHIANLSADTLNLNWNLIAYDSSGGTYLDFCASGECFLGFPLSGSFPSIAPGGIGWAGAHFWTGSVPATSTAKIWVYPQGDPAHGDTLTFILHAQHGSGLDDISHANDEMKIYPNPSPGFIILNIAETAIDTRVDVLNTCGQLMLSKDISNQTSISLDLTHRAKGLYFIKVQSGSGIVLSKVVIGE